MLHNSNIICCVYDYYTVYESYRTRQKVTLNEQDFTVTIDAVFNKYIYADASARSRVIKSWNDVESASDTN